MTQITEQTKDFMDFDEPVSDPFDLSSITSSRDFPPQKILIYGVPGVGKTTFASTFPSPILLRAEDGAAALDIPTFPALVTELRQMDKIVSALLKPHNFKTLIIDSLDWLEPVVWTYTSADAGKASIEDFGYGKGYVKAEETWRRIVAKLEKLRQRGMHIITIAHAVPVTYDAPDTDPYQRYSLKLHKRAAAVWMEWADMVLFLNYRTNVIKSEKEGGKAKAKGSGDRVIHTQERPAYQAKSRWPLDADIFVGNDTTWAAFHEQLNEATQGAYNGN